MIDRFVMAGVHNFEPILLESSLTHQIPGNPFPDHLSNVLAVDLHQESPLSASAPTNSLDPRFEKIPEIISSNDPLDPKLGDLTNWNPVNPGFLREGFDPLLAGGQGSNPSRFTGITSQLEDNSSAFVTIPAFPGVEGFGALSVGGRGGRVIEVTNLKDRGPGSLREAMEAEGPRIVVFRVGGTIRLQSTIRVQDPYLTVAGQTAPGGGILIRGTDSTLLRIEDEAHDIIIRYLRLRNGSGEANGSGHDNISINAGYNIILDHVSMSWSTDENASIYRKRNDLPIYNVTIQRSTLGEGLDGHSTGLIVSGETDFSDPNNPIEAWKEVYNISVHHNLFIHNDTRNPRVTSSGTQVINNVIYNWGRRIGETTRGSIIDVINNYAQAGPISNLDRLFLHENHSPSNPNEPYPDPSIYTEGNIVDPVQTDPNADNWNLWKLNFSQDSVPSSSRRSTPLQQAPIPIDVQSANDAYESVLADVGANARLNCQGNWVFNADDVDQLYLRDILNHRGYDEPISRPHASGGYPDLDPGTPCTDSDHDGMPNLWENQHQLNPQDPTDGSTDAEGDGYTNIEEYLNGQS